MDKALLRVAMVFVVLALVSSAVLLASDSKIAAVTGRWAAVVSAVPLLAVGLSFLIIQLIIRPRATELLKNLLLAATFLLWGAVQLMTPSFVSKILGDVVIALYVTELAWTIVTSVNPVEKRVG
jgi:UPF0716 family protein affecting phage T7 exclusion